MECRRGDKSAGNQNIYSSRASTSSNLFARHHHTKNFQARIDRKRASSTSFSHTFAVSAWERASIAADCAAHDWQMCFKAHRKQTEIKAQASQKVDHDRDRSKTCGSKGSTGSMFNLSPATVWRRSHSSMLVNTVDTVIRIMHHFRSKRRLPMCATSSVL